MSQEFKIKNGLIVSGDATISGAATVNGNSVIHTGNVGSYTVTSLTDTLATVTGRGATTTSAVTVGSLSSTGNINLNGGTLSFNTNYFSINNGGTLARNGGSIALVTDGTTGLSMAPNAGGNKIQIHTQLLLPQSSSNLALANASATDLGLKFFASSLMIFIAGGQDTVKIGTNYFATNAPLTFGSQSAPPYINYNGNHLLINAGTLTTTGYISVQTGNLLVGTTTDSGYKLDVNGSVRAVNDITTNSTFVATSTTLSGSTKYFSIIRSTDSFNPFYITSDKAYMHGVFLQLSGQGGGTIYSSNSVGGASTFITMSGPAYYNSTSGVAGIFAVTGQSYMSSGTATFNALTVAPTINNTGTYSGIFRGFYYNPTLTSLTGTTHRAIETVTGDVIFGSTSGNVGIGTSSPSRKLHVNGDVQVDTNLVVSSGIYNINYYAGSATATYFKNSVGTDTLTILQSGNVGIGTTQPVGQLNVFGGTGNNPAILTLQSQSGGGGNTGIYFRPYQNVTFANTAPAQATILAVDASYSAHITFSTKIPGSGSNALVERMRLSSTGSLMIGSTTDTGEALQVTGSIKSTALSTNGPVVSSGGVLNSVNGYTGMVTVQQPAPMPPITFDIQNGIIVNVMM